MSHPKKMITSAIAVSLCLLTLSVEAKSSKPANLDQMWQIIQTQQKQIEALQRKIAESETGAKSHGEADRPDSDRIDRARADAREAARKKAGVSTARGGSNQDETERKTEVLATEVEKLKTQLHIPDKREYKVEWGYGPAASEVYRVNRGLSIGGYGEWVYSNYNRGENDTIDNYRAVIYAGYKFNDWIILNNEFEFEHGVTGKSGEVAVEFSYLDFMFNENVNARAGLTLVPMGFINEIHEGPTFHGNYRPQTEQTIIPTTWREIGAGLFGQPLPGLQYRIYAMNSLDASGFTSEGIRGGRQSGSKALANDFSFTGRVDYDIPEVPGLLVGGSAWVGNSGQNKEYAGETPSVLTQLYEGHLQWRWKGLEMRALGAIGSIGNAAQLSQQKGQTIGSQNYGWYTEAAYNIMPLIWNDTSQYLAPFFRYESYNTLAEVPDGFTDYDGYYDRWIYQAGLTYKPITNVALKFDYQNFNSARQPLPDRFNLGIAFMY